MNLHDNNDNINTEKYQCYFFNDLYYISIISVYYGFIKYPHNYVLIQKGKMGLGHKTSLK